MSDLCNRQPFNDTTPTDTPTNDTIPTDITPSAISTQGPSVECYVCAAGNCPQYASEISLLRTMTGCAGCSVSDRLPEQLLVIFTSLWNVTIVMWFWNNLFSHSLAQAKFNGTYNELTCEKEQPCHTVNTGLPLQVCCQGNLCNFNFALHVDAFECDTCSGDIDCQNATGGCKSCLVSCTLNLNRKMLNMSHNNLWSVTCCINLQWVACLSSEE
jgi:hypothetical protein